ncbi:MAG TPA: hypothetical protein DD706_23650 [Nitrospiraceae bacterium]|nr:hypothetical protein [Nitrospiraceae bacterium]
MGIASQNALEEQRTTNGASNSGVKGKFGVSGFRPGSYHKYQKPQLVDSARNYSVFRSDRNGS